MKHDIHNLNELSTFALLFLEKLQPSDTHATIVTLRGDLGAGKTAFVKACAQHLGIREEITSPTFVIQKEYSISTHPIFTTLIHIDAYRLKGKEELQYLKWNEIISKPQTIIFLEWPECVAGIDFPNEHALTLNVTPRGDHSITE